MCKTLLIAPVWCFQWLPRRLDDWFSISTAHSDGHDEASNKEVTTAQPEVERYQCWSYSVGVAACITSSDKCDAKSLCVAAYSLPVCGCDCRQRVAIIVSLKLIAFACRSMNVATCMLDHMGQRRQRATKVNIRAHDADSICYAIRTA